MNNDSIETFVQGVNQLYPADMISHKDIAKILSIHHETLYRMRLKGQGPPFVKIGKKVLYLKKDFFDWFKSCYSKNKE